MSNAYSIRIKAHIYLKNRVVPEYKKKKKEPSTVAAGVVISGPRDPLTWAQ